MTYAVRLIPVDHDQCHWCGGKNGQHAPRCDVPAMLAGRASGADLPSDVPAARPSRDEYYDARKAQAGL